MLTLNRSPRWLIKRGRYADAYNSLCRLRDTPLQAASSCLLFSSAPMVFSELTCGAGDLYTIHTQIQVEALLISNPIDLEGKLQHWSTTTDHTIYQEAVKNTSFFSRTLQLFIIPRNRRATLAASVAMIAQYVHGPIPLALIKKIVGVTRLIVCPRQFSGVNIFAFLSASVFYDAGFGKMGSLWFAFGFAASNALWVLR